MGDMVLSFPLESRNKVKLAIERIGLVFVQCVFEENPKRITVKIPQQFLEKFNAELAKLGQKGL